MIWTQPAALGLLIFPAALALLFMAGFRWKKRLLERWGETAARLRDPRAGRQQRVKAVLLVLAGAFLAISLAGPRWGRLYQEVQRRGIDVMIAVDVSASMLAEDVKPNRLALAKQELGLFIAGMEGDRVGLVAFAGTAFLQCPLTLDHGAARTLLDLISTDLIPKPGTSLADAIRKSCDAFPPGPAKYKALVLLTDGEDNGGELDAAVQRAADEGVRIFAIGIGNTQGEVIPIRDENGQLIGYKKDKNGQTVVSKLDPAALERMASATRGRYYPAGQGDLGVGRVLDDLKKMEKRNLDSRLWGQYENHYAWPLAAALALLLLEFFLPEVPGHWTRLLGRLRSAFLLVFLLLPGRPLKALGRYPTSQELSAAAEKQPKDPETQFRLGHGLFQEKSYAAAAEVFEKSQKASQNPAIQSAAAYNAGTSRLLGHQLDQGIEKLKESLRLNPDDPDAKYNLEMALRAKHASQKKPRPGKPQDDKDQKDKNPSGNGKDQPQKTDAAKPGEMSKEDAERLLEAIQAQEKDARKKQSRKPEQTPAGPDW